MEARTNRDLGISKPVVLARIKAEDVLWAASTAAVLAHNYDPAVREAWRSGQLPLGAPIKLVFAGDAVYVAVDIGADPENGLEPLQLRIALPAHGLPYLADGQETFEVTLYADELRQAVYTTWGADAEREGPDGVSSRDSIGVLKDDITLVLTPRTAISGQTTVPGDLLVGVQPADSDDVRYVPVADIRRISLRRSEYAPIKITGPSLDCDPGTLLGLALVARGATGGEALIDPVRGFAVAATKHGGIYATEMRRMPRTNAEGPAKNQVARVPFVVSARHLMAMAITSHAAQGRYKSIAHAENRRRVALAEIAAVASALAIDPSLEDILARGLSLRLLVGAKNVPNGMAFARVILDKGSQRSLVAEAEAERIADAAREWAATRLGISPDDLHLAVTSRSDYTGDAVLATVAEVWDQARGAGEDLVQEYCDHLAPVIDSAILRTEARYIANPNDPGTGDYTPFPIELALARLEFSKGKTGFREIMTSVLDELRARLESQYGPPPASYAQAQAMVAKDNVAIGAWSAWARGVVEHLYLQQEEDENEIIVETLLEQWGAAGDASPLVIQDVNLLYATVVPSAESVDISGMNFRWAKEEKQAAIGRLSVDEDGRVFMSVRSDDGRWGIMVTDRAKTPRPEQFYSRYSISPDQILQELDPASDDVVFRVPAADVRAVFSRALALADTTKRTPMLACVLRYDRPEHVQGKALADRLAEITAVDHTVSQEGYPIPGLSSPDPGGNRGKLLVFAFGDEDELRFELPIYSVERINMPTDEPAVGVISGSRLQDALDFALGDRVEYALLGIRPDGSIAVRQAGRKVASIIPCASMRNIPEQARERVSALLGTADALWVGSDVSVEQVQQAYPNLPSALDLFSLAQAGSDPTPEAPQVDESIADTPTSARPTESSRVESVDSSTMDRDSAAGSDVSLEQAKQAYRNLPVQIDLFNLFRAPADPAPEPPRADTSLADESVSVYSVRTDAVPAEPVPSQVVDSSQERAAVDESALLRQLQALESDLSVERDVSDTLEQESEESDVEVMVAVRKAVAIARENTLRIIQFDLLGNPDTIVESKKKEQQKKRRKKQEQADPSQMSIAFSL